MSEITYPVHENLAVQEEIDRKVTADVFTCLFRGSDRVAREKPNRGDWTERNEATNALLNARHVSDINTIRLRGALAVANANPITSGSALSPEASRIIRDSLDDDLESVELGSACSVAGEECESCQ